MRNRIRIRRTSTAGKVPTTLDLQEGELGLNIVDKKLYSSDGTNVFEIGASNPLYSSSNTDITSLISGSTEGTLIEGLSGAHLVVGIKGNDAQDGFHIIDKGNASTPNTDPYLNRLFSVSRSLGVNSTLPISAPSFLGSGVSLTSLNASNLSSGTVPNARLSGAYTGITSLSLTGPITLSNQGELRLSELTTNGTNYITLRSPAALASNITFTLPATLGSNGQVLSTDASGNLSWANNSADNLGNHIATQFLDMNGQAVINAASYNSIPIGRGGGDFINNTFVGFNTFLNNTTGNRNTAIGANNLTNNTTGSNNSAIGVDAGRFTSNGTTALTVINNSSFFGASTKGTQNATNENVFGFNATGNGSNTVTLGNDSITNTYLKGVVNISNTTASTSTITGALVVNGGVGVAGTVNAYVFAGNNADSVTTPSFTWTGNFNTGIYHPTVNEIGLTTGGTEALRLSSTGTDIFGVLAIKDAPINTSIAINSLITLSSNSTRYGIVNILNLSNETLTANRITYGAFNQIISSDQNASAFSLAIYGSFNDARTTASGGSSSSNLNVMYGAFNRALHMSDNATYKHIATAYGAYNVSQTSGSTATITTAIGSFNYVLNNNVTSVITTAYATQNIITASPVGSLITNAYLFKGDYEGSGTITNKYGLYIADLCTNYTLNMQIGGTVPTGGGTAGLGVGTAATGAGNINATGSITATSFSGSGASLTSLNASNLSSGTIPDARLTGSYTGLTNLTGSGTAIFAAFNATNNTGGRIVISTGSATQAGLLQIYKNDGTTRLGYIGWSNTDLTYVSENSAKHILSGGVVNITNTTASTSATAGALVVTGGISTSDDIFTTNLSYAAGAGNGLRFWGVTDAYKIYMSQSTDATYGGRLDTTSDYNIYFKIGSGTNRGFVFMNNTTPVAQIEGSGRLRLTDALIMDGNTVIDAGGGWHRSYGNTGWYNATHLGGMYMEDTVWVRTYNGKSLYSSNSIGASGAITVINGISPANGAIRLTPALHLNAGAGHAVWLNHDSGAGSAGNATFIVSNGAAGVLFRINYNGYISTASTIRFGSGGGVPTDGNCGVITWNSISSGAGTVEFVDYCGSGGATCFAFYRVPSIGTPAAGNIIASINQAGTYTVLSDERVKKDIKDIEYGLNTVLALRPRKYNHYVNNKFEDGKVENGDIFVSKIGLVAQEVYPIVPEIVEKPENEKEGFYSLDYTSLIPVLIKAIQEQQDQIDVLKTTVKVLMTKLNSI